MVGEVIHIDRFGNLFTNIRERDLTGVAKQNIRFHLNEIKIQGLAQNYTAGDKDSYIALINSCGLIEIASYNDNAAHRSEAKIGDKVRVELLTR